MNKLNISTGAKIIIGLVLLLLVLHQDNWNWDKSDLVFGFIPIGLAWHAGISIAASCVWFLATLIAWPAPATYDETPNQQEVSS